MDSFDISATNKIVSLISERLNRSLTAIELSTFKLPRSGMAYEMIIDTITSSESPAELENYVKNVVEEYKTTHNIR